MRPSLRRFIGIVRPRAILVFTALALILSGFSPMSPGIQDASAAMTDESFLSISPNTLGFGKNPFSSVPATDPVSGEKMVYTATYGAGGAVTGPGRLYAISLDNMGAQVADLDMGWTRPVTTLFNQNTNQIFVTRQWQGDVAVVTGTMNDNLLTLDTAIHLGFSPNPPYLGIRPYFAALNKTTNKVYVPRNQGATDVAVIDGYDPYLTIDAMPKIEIGDAGSGLAIDEARNIIYVARPDPTHQDIAVIDGNTNTLTDTIPIGASAQGLTFNPANGKLYAAIPCSLVECAPNAVNVPGENTVSVVDTNTMTEMYKIKAGIGNYPANLAANPVTNRVYVASAFSAQISVIDSATDGVIQQIASRNSPQGVTVDPATNRVFVTSLNRDIMFSSVSEPGGVQVFLDAPSSPPPPKQFYAEGTTRPGFQTYLTLYQPDMTGTVMGDTLRVTYNLGPGQGVPIIKDYYITRGTRGTVNVNADIGPDKDVSTQVESLSGRPFFAERVMYFNGVVIGASDGTTSPGRSNFWTQASAPDDDYWFVEGTTRPGFREYLTLLSPNTTHDVAINYFFGPGQGTCGSNPNLVTLTAGVRTTIDVGSVPCVGAGKDVTVHVQSTTPGDEFFAERPMYFTGIFWGITGGHDGLGLPPNPFTDTVFPEGTTRTNFRTYLTLLSETDQRVAITEYMAVASDPSQQAQNVVSEVTLPANQRVTIDLKDVVGWDQDIATRITSCGNNPDCKNVDPGLPFYAERPMYFSSLPPGNASGGTVNTPITANSYWPKSMQTDYYMAEGTNRIQVTDYQISGGFQTYLTLLSPDITSVVTISLAMAPGEPVVQFQVPLNKARRTTVDLNFYSSYMGGPDRDFAIRVQAAQGQAFYVERPMYFSNVVNGTQGGTISTGQHN